MGWFYGVAGSSTDFRISLLYIRYYFFVFILRKNIRILRVKFLFMILSSVVSYERFSILGVVLLLFKGKSLNDSF